VLFPFSQSGSPPRVVITGSGIITALGQGWNINAEGFRAGRVAIRPVTQFDVSGQRVKNAAEVDLPASHGPTHPKDVCRLDRAGKMLLLAAEEAWKQAGWTPGDIPIVLGTTSGGMTLGQDYYRQAINTPGSRRQQATRVAHYQPQRQGLDLAESLGCTGPLTTIANACASGANAIGHAWEILRRGQSARVITGGYDALSQLVFSGFDSLQALSPTQCRPFDANRDGLALGEGAAVLTLETLESARARDAQILGEIIGYGAATDSHHLTQPHPNGDAALASMTAACQSAQINPEAVDYINAHGTGTPLNDVAEAAAINRWARANAARIPVSSTKSSIGHLLGAAGAVEIVISLMALKGQWLPPTSTTETVDPACAFPLVRKPTDARVSIALSNSFGFGGANATVILRRWS
jgi:3-oxoacyl-[acyl-carrier-protein] synthase II